MAAKYILSVMDMKLRTGLKGKITVFHLKHPLSMLNMYCILELRRGITIPQIYMAKRVKKRFGAKILQRIAGNLTEVRDMDMIGF
jgi:hypothetical protein